MFAKTIVLSDAFLDLPLGARCLYYTLGMVADDDGFINSPKAVMRQCGANEHDLELLIEKKFVISFDGVVVIKHWKINNYIQKDRYVPTKYAELRQYLSLDVNNAYHKEDEPCIQNVYTDSVYTGKDSIGKDRIGYIYKHRLPDFEKKKPKGNDIEAIRKDIFDYDKRGTAES